MKTMYLHGFRGRRTRHHIECLKTFGLDVYAKHIEYTESDDGYQEAKTFALKHQVEFVVGHSHGGFYAFWLAEDLGLPCLLSNPHLSLSAKKKVSPKIDQQACPLCLLGLGEDDRAVPFTGTVNYLNQYERKDANIHYRVHEAAGHRLDDESFKDLIQWSLDEIALLNIVTD